MASVSIAYHCLFVSKDLRKGMAWPIGEITDSLPSNKDRTRNLMSHFNRLISIFINKCLSLL